MIYLFMNNGGMGNQMFQYAIARKLQLEYDMDIVCDLTKFNYKNTNATRREYCLDAFNLTNRLSYKNVIFHKIYYKLVKKWISLKKMDTMELYKQFTQKGIFSPCGYFNYYPEGKCEVPNIFVNGLFQAHQYFDEILPVLQRDFTFRIPPRMEICGILKRIDQEESVCIHWRRGDYLTKQYRNSLLVCDESYYNRAIAKILEKVENPTLYIFTNSVEDAEWIENNHQFNVPVNYINTMIKEKHTDLDEFRIMCACKHFIISNSTFSWWAQYLSPNESKVVVAPSIWNRKENAKSLYFDDWEVIPV